jgi:carbon-monoxide dehydrogenase catalytic subunit
LIFSLSFWIQARGAFRPPKPLRALAFRLLGIDSYHCVFAATLGSDRAQNFLEHETRELLGAAAIVETDPKQLATRIVADLEQRRLTLPAA